MAEKKYIYPKTEVSSTEYFEKDCKIDFSEHPNALPDGFIKKPSPIHGEGIFTTYDWPCNTRLTISHLELAGKIWRNGGVGSYINHQDDANCRLDFEGPYGYLTSVGKIEAGTELTLDYFIEECGKGIKKTC